MARSVTLWSACGCLYQHLNYSFNLSLSLWSLSKLPCAKFWDPLKMNVASTLCLSWWANFVSIWLATCELVCEDVFISFLQHWVIPLYSCHICLPYLLGRRKILVTMFIFETWRAFGSLEGFWYSVGFWCSIIGFYFRL